VSVADFSADVRRADVKVAEELVYQALVRKGVQVDDCRGQCLAWDFRLVIDEAWKTLDVKFDSYIEASERFPFEGVHIGTDGTRWDGWGLHADLDYVAVVGMSMISAHVINLREFRPFVLSSLMADIKPDWRPFHRPNTQNPNRPPYTTHGWAVPIAVLKASGVAVHRMSLRGVKAA